MRIIKRKVKLFIGLLLSGLQLILSENTAYAQEKIFNHINVEDGLSKSSVLSISEDGHGFLWFGTTYGLNKFNGLNFTVYKNDLQNSASISGNYVEALFRDKDKNLWIGTNNGLDVYNASEDTFEHIIPHQPIKCIYQSRDGAIWVGSYKGLFLVKGGQYSFLHKRNISFSQLISSQVNSILEDHCHNIWVGTSTCLTRGVLKKGKYELQAFKHHEDTSFSVGDNDITAIEEDKYHRLWIGTHHHGINLLDPVSGNLRRFSSTENGKNSLIDNNIRKLLADGQGNIWVGTQEGLSLINIENFQVASFQHDPADPNSLSQNSIYDIYKDVHGSFWIGTYFGGVNQVNSISTPFTIYQNNSYKNSLSSNVISAIIEDRHHNLWIGTEAEGLNYFNKKSNHFSYFKNSIGDSNSLSSNLIKSIFVDKDDSVWIGMSRGGMDRFDPVKNTFSHYRYHAHDQWGINSDNVGYVYKDSRGRLWVGTDNGLNYFNNGKFENYTNTPGKYQHLNTYVSSIFEDSHQNLWVGSSKGICVLKNGASLFSTVAIDFKTHQITCIKEDRYGTLWIGSENGGLAAYDPQTRKLKLFSVKNGLPSNNVLGILQDNQGFLWVSTDNGLFKFNPATGGIENYSLHDGLPGKEFNNGSYFKDNQGRLFFGTYNGLVSFNPSLIKQNPYPPKVVFTELKLFNRPIHINDNSKLLKQAIEETQTITFSNDQNVFAINFAALNFIKPLKNKYAYKLEGFEKQWNYVSIPSATYTNLSSGTYTLLVKAANNDGVWSLRPTTLTIIILPPLWKTWWAYLSYLIIVLAILYYIIRFFQIRAKLAYDLNLEQKELEQQKEMHQMKLNFFTNVSHEIRTPLTLILGPVEKLITLTRDNKPIQQYLNAVKTNTDRLNKLINELLDFRKAESGKIHLQISEDNIVRFAHEIFISFKDLAQSKQMVFDFTSTEEVIPVFFDKYQLEKVFYNLLSNAFKFTPAGGHIKVHLAKNANDKTVEISVMDNGQGIPEGSLDKIFQNFYQINHAAINNVGTGIGLALTKSIVELHGGQITVESKLTTNEQNGFTCFKIVLQSGNGHLENIIIDDKKSYPGPPDLEHAIIDKNNTGEFIQYERQTKEKAYTILVVEDNAEVRNFVKDALNANYKIEVRENGLKGWEAAIQLIPDLIISDIMMPIMDGVELCKKIKTDNRTCHIPFILLTALSDLTQRINGLEEGADAYITKPFSLQLLQLNIHNMLALKEAVQKRHNQNLFLGPRDFIGNSQDEKFLYKLVDLIEQNMDNSELSLADLTAELGMSKSVLYKKFNALTDLSLTDFIKNQRLKKAAGLLKQHQVTVAEISHQVGFNDVKYFSKEFKKMYGVTPSHYLKNL